MIVKDESHIIEKTFDNLLSQLVLDYWVICDTGSTDGTQDLIKKYFAKKGIPGELVQHEWRDFGYNRTEALKAAFKKSDYILIFDADDSIHGEFKLPSKLTHDFYKLQFGKGFTYYRPLLVTAHKPTSFIGVLHEFLKLNHGNPTEANVPGNYYVESGRLGNRSKAGDKYLKDALILKAAYEKEVATGGDLANRYAFYCAQSYKDCGKDDESIEWYTLVADKLNSWLQERYYSCVTLGHLYKGKQNTEKALEYYLKSEKFDPERKEGIIYACEILKDKGLFSLVTLLYEKNRDYERNPRDKLFMHRDIYDDILEFNAAISYCMMDKAKEGYNLFKEVVLRQIAPTGAIGVSYKNLQVLEKFLLSDKNTIELFYKLNDFIQNSKEAREFSSLWNKLFEKHRSNLTAIPKSFKIPKRPCEILLTMTSCKRYDLFHETVNSMLNHWTDKSKIDKWICVDDNSSKDDRKLMKSTYPFIEFYLKTPAEKGHRESMNIIWNMLKEHTPKYWIHIEDDFLFHTKRSYIEDSIKLIEKHSDIHQVLFNRGYAETMDQVDLRGYIPLEPGYVVHEYKQGQFSYPNCHYWPHYSFRPGVIRADTILKLGNYDSPNTFFEMDYAKRWTEAGYKSAFFDSINCRHIGRLTSERNSSEKKNAYDLNGEGQFNKMNPIKVINLKRRPDRREQVTKVLKDVGITDFDIVEAVDGKELLPTFELAKLFEGNDFGNRRGVVGCALSHYNLWKALLADPKTNYYVIFEDDITLSENFKAKFEALKPVFEKEEYVFLGYHMFTKNREKTRDMYVKESESIQIAPMDNNLNIGAGFAYSLNKAGAKILVDYIAQNGIKHGIDYVVKICSELKCKEVRPQIVFSDWYETPGQNVDTDIQKDVQGINFRALTNLANQFEFISGKDHIGDDLYFSRMSLEEMMSKALSDPNCQGFNTLGFFKTRANKFTASQYFKENDGMYVKKTVEMPTYTPNEATKVKILCNWASSKDVSKEFSCMNIPEIETVNKNPDYFVIINSPPPGEVYDPSRTILMQMEPWVYDDSKNWGVKTWGEWAEPDPAKFMHVHSHKKFLNNVQWTLGGDLSKLPDKQDRISFIVSQKLNDTGHVLRHQYVSKFPEMIDVFGRANYHSLSNYIGQVPGDDRYNVYSDYKYALAVENNSEHNYASEKIWEPLLCECLVFYWGCPNLEDYIDSRAFVRLPLENPEEASVIIQRAVRENWWSQRIDVIRQMKKKVMTQLGMFPMLTKIIMSQKTKAVIITMKTSEARRPFVKKLVTNATEFGIDHEIFYGVNGKEITVSGNEITYEGETMKYDPEVRLNKQRMAIGEFGCSWSQIKLYQKLVADPKYDNYLIFEDDAELVGDISILHNLPSSFDIIKLCSSDWFPYVKTNAVNKNFFNIEKRFTSRNTGYIISKAGAKKLLAITNGHVNVPADDLISNAFIRHQIEVIVSEFPVFDFPKDNVSTTDFTVY